MTCNNAAEAQKGAFITFEGGEGAGKTTHIRFLSQTLEAMGREVVCLREPGGTSIGEQLRAVVLDPCNDAMADECELMIYLAARAQLVAQIVKPALERGAVVLCNRFSDSTMAYQGFGRGLDRDLVRRANDFACQGIRPDRTILLVPPSTRAGLARATVEGADRLEAAGDAFHERVNAAFAQMAAEEPERMRTVRSASKKSDTARAVFAELADLFPQFEECLTSPTFFKALDGAQVVQGARSGAKEGGARSGTKEDGARSGMMEGGIRSGAMEDSALDAALTGAFAKACDEVPPCAGASTCVSKDALAKEGDA